MISTKIIAISELKSGPWKDLQEHYLKLLRAYARVNLIEVKPEKFSNPSERERVLEAEMKKIKKQIPDGSVVIVLEADAETPSSEKLSKKIETWSDGGRTLCFIIGGPLGLSQGLKTEANHLLSLSPMTFPHDFARVILLEQIYRASTITAGKTYHY